MQIDISLEKDFILRDKFDWDLSQGQLRPIDFVTCLVMQLPEPYPSRTGKIKHKAAHLRHLEVSEGQMAVIEKLTEQVLRQINEHIDKNTFFPRQRLNKKEEDIIAKQQVCVNCDSLLNPNTPDFCF